MSEHNPDWQDEITRDITPITRSRLGICPVYWEAPLPQALQPIFHPKDIEKIWSKIPWCILAPHQTKMFATQPAVHFKPIQLVAWPDEDSFRSYLEILVEDIRVGVLSYWLAPGGSVPLSAFTDKFPEEYVRIDMDTASPAHLISAQVYNPFGVRVRFKLAFKGVYNE